MDSNQSGAVGGIILGVFQGSLTHFLLIHILIPCDFTTTEMLNHYSRCWHPVYKIPYLLTLSWYKRLVSLLLAPSHWEVHHPFFSVAWRSRGSQGRKKFFALGIKQLQGSQTGQKGHKMGPKGRESVGWAAWLLCQGTARQV